MVNPFLNPGRVAQTYVKADSVAEAYATAYLDRYGNPADSR